LKVSRYNKNVKTFRPYLARQNGHVTTSTSSSSTKNIATKACFKTWTSMVWFCLIRLLISSGQVQSNWYELFFIFVSFSLFFKFHKTNHDVTYWCCLFYNYIL